MKKLFCIILLIFSTTIFSQTNLNINLLYHWEDTTIPATTAHQNTYNEIWGYAKNGREYAIIGSTRGTHFFDVTNPSSPTMVDFVIGRDTGSQIVHRDYHDYKDYLYAVSDEGDASLQIIDLSFLPDSVHVVYDSDTALKRSHNIFIDSTSGNMYSCGGTSEFDVFSLANPTNPVISKKCHIDIPWWANTVGSGGYVHDVYVKNDTAWCNAGNGLYVVDFNNINNPALLSSLTSYPDGGYNHSGWLNEQGDIYALADETHGKKVKIFDVSDLSNIQFVDTIGSDVTHNSIPHNLIFKGNYLFVSFYFDGLYVWDMTNPSNPVLVGFYDTSTEINYNNFRGNWGVYPFLPSGTILASDMQKGLFVFDASQATSIKKNELKNRFKVFPNPFKDNITVMGLSDFNKNYNLTLSDVSGKTIINKEFTNTFLAQKNIPISNNIPEGIYFLTISNNKFVQSIKLIKE